MSLTKSIYLLKQNMLRAALSLMIMLAIVLSLNALSGCSHEGNNDPIQQWPLNQTCNLHKSACITQHDKQKVILDIYPKPIPIARMFKVRVKLENLYAENIQLDIAGVNMYMGYNRVTLRPVLGQPGLYEGQSMLAFCTNKTMQWQFTVMIKTTDHKKVQAPFYLETKTR